MPNALLVSRLGDQTWAALTRAGRIVELHVASPAQPDPVERIVRGRVCGVRPETRSAFVAIGLERPAFLPADDLLLPGEGPATPPPIQDRLATGRDLTVQVVRGPEAGKGARVTCRVGLPGRRLVCRPFERQSSVSRRIADPAERRRLGELLLRCPAEAGWIARTAAAEADGAEILDEAERLLARWRRIEERAETTAPPGLLLSEPDLLDRLLRDLPADRLEWAVVDTLEDRQRVASRVASVELHSGPAPLVQAHGLLAEAGRLLSPRIPLPSGGHLLIERTEALVAIDVNTGSAGPALRTNLEAVAEVARQLRLRDLGGTIVVDLVEMAAEDDRLRVGEALALALREDRARTRLARWSDRRLLHLTRRRTRPGLDALLTRPCGECAGLGARKSELLVAAERLAGPHAGPE